MPKVTIGLPFFNNESTIEQAVRSINAQTFVDWELIAVDDGSTDGSVEIVRECVDPRVHLIQDGRNLGLPARLNQIAECARGEYLARMDADDIMHPDRLGYQVRFLLENPTVDVVGTGLYSIDLNSNPVGMRMPPIATPSTKCVLTGRVPAHVTIMGNKEWFQSNPYDESLNRSQDFELWVRTHRYSKFASIDVPLMFVREAGTVSASKYAKSETARRKVLRTYGPELVGLPSTGSLITSSFLKQFAYFVLERVGAIDVAVGRRNTPLAQEQLLKARGILKQIQATPVCGHDAI